MAKNGDRDCRACPRTKYECEFCEIKLQEFEHVTAKFDWRIVEQARLSLLAADKYRRPDGMGAIKLKYPKHSTPEFDALLDAAFIARQEFEEGKRREEEKNKPEHGETSKEKYLREAQERYGNLSRNR